METERGHVAVLQQEALLALEINPTGIYLDGTYGRGGHSELILQSLGDEGRLVALDQDPEAIADGKRRFGDEPRFSLYKRNFEALEEVAVEAGVAGRLNGILLDLGVSSPQLDTAARGFSFNQDGYLDMRMDPEQGLSASEWLSEVSVEELAAVLRDYGDERFAKRIARAIVAEREDRPLTSTLQLAEVIKVAHPRWDHQRHPATKSFQAIRIHVNRELAVLQKALEQSAKLLAIGGRLVVISFHSLEDRAVKRFLRGPVRDQNLPRHLPVVDTHVRTMKPLKKQTAGEAELERNPRARSAVLRIGVRVA
ncbi:MAG: 16S rRNA (cytosine(1402)-N(4))-methyltransferase RsmH [Granulosicoccus sp.]|nr:16S rRNA (cytosine(1402)-N(4))-methyltransferase RsmH [Granulosicoccus sp.]